MTELVSGVDIVSEQLWLAPGRPCPTAALAAAAAGRRADRPRDRGPNLPRTRAAISLRPGSDRTLSAALGPRGPGRHRDRGGGAGAARVRYLIAKVMVLAPDRPAAIERLRRALDETEIGGVQTTLPFHRFVARSPAFASAELSTGFAADYWDGPASQASRSAALGRALLGAGLAEATSASLPGPGRRPGTGRTSGRASAWRAAPTDDDFRDRSR